MKQKGNDLTVRMGEEKQNGGLPKQKGEAPELSMMGGLHLRKPMTRRKRRI
jgi:hypothetical protein